MWSLRRLENGWVDGWTNATSKRKKKNLPCCTLQKLQPIQKSFKTFFFSRISGTLCLRFFRTNFFSRKASSVVFSDFVPMIFNTLKMIRFYKKDLFSWEKIFNFFSPQIPPPAPQRTMEEFRSGVQSLRAYSQTNELKKKKKNLSLALSLHLWRNWAISWNGAGVACTRACF